MMKEILEFADREAFRTWLSEHCLSDEGVWLLFGKAGGPKTIKAAEALEEALCFGWIDGQMKSIDDKSYIKYFSQRRKNSKWSQKNKQLTEALEKSGRMSEYGRAKIAEAKQNGQWNAANTLEITDAHISQLASVLKQYETAYNNFQSMSLSVKKTYTRAYFDAKSEEGKEKRIAWMVERLNQNLKPM